MRIASIAATCAAWNNAGGVVADPLSTMDDLFPGEALDAKWTKLQATTDTLDATVSGGEVFLEIARGSSSGSQMFDNNDYSMLYQTVTGAFDARARCRVTGSDGASAVGVSSTRLGALNAADPANTASVLNYVQIAAGTTGGVPLQYQWMTTDAIAAGSTDESAFGGDALTDAIVGVDFRIVRRLGALQTFDLYVRRSSLATNLLDDNDWTLAQTINREDNNVPERDTFGALANQAVALPSEVRIGLAVGATVSTHNVAMYCSEFRVRTPT